MRRLLLTTLGALLLAAGCGGEETRSEDPCARCGEAESCVNGACIPRAPVCNDGLRNGQETDVDCGGGSCPRCAAGKACAAAADCASGLCEANRCVEAPACDDGIKDGAESDVDCGGGCAQCAYGKACVAAADCASGLCEASRCVAPPACDNGIKDGTETDVDCGGACEARCAEGQRCLVHEDCLSGLCAVDVCAPPRIEVMLDAANDAVSSYLLDAVEHAWNIYSGSFVPLGRHWDGDHVSYHTALRFHGVLVPAGATITDARLSFHPTNETDSANNLWINVYAEKRGDSAPFDPTNYDSGRPDQRSHTTALIDHWLVRCRSDCTDLNEYDCPQRKLDCWDRATRFTVPKNLKDLVQEIVSRPDWAQGNALTLLLVNSATDEDGLKYRESRSIVGFDPERGAEYSPKLVVEWQMPAAR